MAKAKAPVVNEIQVFDEFTDKEVLTISKFSEKKYFQRSEVVFQESSVDSSLYVVLKGQLEALAHTSEGKEIPLSKIDEGEVFGELSFLDGKSRSATIIALDDVELLEITRDDFNKLREGHPDIASKLIMDLARVVSLRLRNADKFIVDIHQLISHEESKAEESVNEKPAQSAKSSKNATTSKSKNTGTKALKSTSAKNTKVDKAESNKVKEAAKPKATKKAEDKKVEAKKTTPKKRGAKIAYRKPEAPKKEKSQKK